MSGSMVLSGRRERLGVNNKDRRRTQLWRSSSSKEGVRERKGKESVSRRASTPTVEKEDGLLCRVLLFPSPRARLAVHVRRPCPLPWGTWDPCREALFCMRAPSRRRRFIGPGTLACLACHRGPAWSPRSHSVPLTFQCWQFPDEPGFPSPQRPRAPARPRMPNRALEGRSLAYRALKRVSRPAVIGLVSYVLCSPC